MSAGVPAELLAERRAAFQERIGEGIAIVPGARLQTRSNDVDYPFRQNSDLLYLCAWPQPEAIAVFSKDRFILFVQPRDPGAETWTGRRPGVEGACERYGADEAHPTAEFQERLPGLLGDVPRLFYSLGAEPRLDPIVREALREVRRHTRGGVRAPNEIVDPYGILHEMRLYKDPAELALMRRAAEISYEGHHEAARLCRSGNTEYEIEAVLDWVFRKRGSTGPAYPSIVGSGDNATILHYTENGDTLREGQLVLIDAGCEYEAYASDITRTYPVDGRFEGIARDVYEIVLRAQADAIEKAGPGVALTEIHDVATRTLVSGLIELGVLEGDAQELMEQENHTRFYMHRTSHWLGMDVHDVGEYHVEGKPRALEPGMVFTIEPGLYFGAEESKCAEKLRGIGVRIEDDLVVTEAGCDVISKNIPKRIDEVEAWMRS